MTTQIKTILDESNMSLADFSYALGINSRSLERMVTGRIETPPGVIGDALQIIQDIDYINALVEDKPEIANISYKVFKLVLDSPIG